MPSRPCRQVPSRQVCIVTCVHAHNKIFGKSSFRVQCLDQQGWKGLSQQAFLLFTFTVLQMFTWKDKLLPGRNPQNNQQSHHLLGAPVLTEHRMMLEGSNNSLKNTASAVVSTIHIYPSFKSFGTAWSGGSGLQS